MDKVSSLPITIEEADLLEGAFVIRLADGRAMRARRDEGRLLLFRGVDEPPIGVIIRGCDWAGSVWIGGDCIGEYERRPDGYRIVPVVGLKKRTAEARMENPLDYLVQRVAARSG